MRLTPPKIRRGTDILVVARTARSQAGSGLARPLGQDGFPQKEVQGCLSPWGVGVHQRGSPKEGSVPASRARRPRPVGTRQDEARRAQAAADGKAPPVHRSTCCLRGPRPQAKDGDDALKWFRKLQEWSYFAAGEHDTKFQFPRLHIKFYWDTPRALVCGMSTVHGGFHAVKWL